MATEQLLRGKVMRLTRLDECCSPLPSATECAFTVTSGYITVSMSPEYEDGDEFIQKNANGELCINENQAAQLKRITTEIELCGVDFSVVEIATGDRLETSEDPTADPTEPIGVRSITGLKTANFALEVWTGVGGQACDPAGNPEYGYFLLPCLTGGQIAEYTIENGPINITIESAFTKANAGWGSGPYDVVMVDDPGSPGTPIPGPLGVPIAGDEHRLMRKTSVAPPAPTDGCQTMP